MGQVKTSQPRAERFEKRIKTFNTGVSVQTKCLFCQENEHRFFRCEKFERLDF